jgi:hypothetical protein
MGSLEHGDQLEEERRRLYIGRKSSQRSAEVGRDEEEKRRRTG